MKKLIHLALIAWLCCGFVQAQDRVQVQRVITIKNTTSTAVWKGAYIGNKTGITWPSANIDYDGFRKTGTGQGGQHCQFQSPTCPALTHGLSPYSVDPGFLNPSTWDLRPRCASEGTISPLIDVGASLGYSTDYAGTSIPQDGSGVRAPGCAARGSRSPSRWRSSRSPRRRCRRPPSTTSPASNGYRKRRIFVWSVRPLSGI